MNCNACSNLDVDYCVCGEVVCLSCNRKLNRDDLNCYACGSVKLDRSKLEMIEPVISTDRTLHRDSPSPWYKKWFVNKHLGILCRGHTRLNDIPVKTYYSAVDFNIDTFGLKCQYASCVCKHPDNPCCH